MNDRAAQRSWRRRPGASPRALALAVLWLLHPRFLAADAPVAAVWESYNAGVRAYAAGDFTNALSRWQDLTLQPLPRGLRQPVWFQVGNAQFRLGEQCESASPEEAAELWRRAGEAYRSALRARPGDAAAQHNLDLASRRLSALLHRLGNELVREAETKPVDPAIDLLRTGVENLREAAAIGPDEPAVRNDRERAETRLRQRLLERAGREEAKGDEAARPRSSWSDAEAEFRYRAALEDLAPAPAPARDALQEQAEAAQLRVSQKLAELLVRMGQRDQRQGDEQAGMDPEEALPHYERALDEFQQAQQVQTANAAAQRGEREVRAAMEKLHVSEGQAELERGREALARQSPVAASALTTALGHFQAAQELNPASQEAKAGAEETRRLLPAALVLAGEKELRAGEQAEPHFATEALARYQEAETAFRQSLELKPDQPKAQAGAEEAERRQARLRERVAQEAKEAAQRAMKGQPKPTLDSLLGEVQKREEPRWDERQRQRARNQPGGRRGYPDW